MVGALVGLLFGTGVFCLAWSWWPRPPRRTSERRPLLAGLHDEVIQAGYHGLHPRTLIVACVVLAALVFFFGTALTRAPAVAACFAAIAASGPIVFVRGRARHRRRNLRDLWPDAVDNITSAVRAGLALPEALAQLAHRGPEELRPAFSSFAEDYRATGRFNDCLDRLKDRLADPVGDRLIESLRIAREVGGSDLGTLLRTLSTFLREDARTRAELEARQSWTVNAARLAVAAPWAVLAMLAARPESIAAYNTRTGVIVLVLGAAVSVVAYRVMIRIGRLPEEGRVLG